MKKMISMLLAVLMLCSVMAGCGNTGNPDTTTGAPENSTGAADTTGGADGNEDIKITDTFSVSDPEGVAYETRHIYSGDKNCMMLQGMTMQGYNASAVYVILYENEGKAVGEYQIIVTDSEEDANKLKTFYTSVGQNLTQEGAVLYTFSDADMIQSSITMYAGLGAISEDTVEAYLNYLSTTNGLTKQ